MHMLQAILSKEEQAVHNIQQFLTFNKDLKFAALFLDVAFETLEEIAEDVKQFAKKLLEGHSIPSDMKLLIGLLDNIQVQLFLQVLQLIETTFPMKWQDLSEILHIHLLKIHKTRIYALSSTIKT